MFKKVLVAVVLALSFCAAIGVQAAAPPPQCGTGNNPPCPWVN
jgi:hypothetical protein